MALDNGNNPQSNTDEISTADLLWEPPETSKADRAPKTDRIVFGVSAVLALAFLAWGVIARDSLSKLSASAMQGLIHNAGWGFVLAASGFVVFALWLAFSKYGSIRLGRDDEAPEFKTLSWIAMMFGAGMGIGLVFYGVSEPISHYLNAPPGTEPVSFFTGGTTEAKAAVQGQAIEHSMATTLFHWTLHPWSIYAVVGLAIAYGAFRRGRGQLISAAFTPLIGERHANGAVGRVIDIFALFATLFGTAASLGIGTLQIAGGLKELGWVDNITNPVLIGVIGVLMVCFLLSAVSGVAKGIQWLSNTNLVLAFLLLFFLLFAGATVFIFNLFPTALGSYINELFSMSARTADVGGDATETWLSGWTIFYWAWWISWSPFVGMFIARISRGRTIRQFIGGVILVPSALSLVWFCVMGGSALSMEQNGNGVSGADGAEGQLFALLGQYPAPTFMMLLTIVLIAIFFITGADSASIVMGTMSQRGAIRPQRKVTVFWGVMMGGVAAIMMLIGGSDALTGLQNLTIIVAAPFTIIIVLMCVALVRDLQRDPVVLRSAKGEEVVAAAVIAGAQDHDGDFQLEISSTDDSAEAAEETADEDGGSAPDDQAPAYSSTGG
ncbi:BCCT family transporter [Nocardiopsis gilva YIM 90087]|uniref:BCCT family transporter n=1 Tax=Nocardiopsis gilva YIM 90087 TaxID=1235441 RepID=A0A223SCE3_9ACTN|nr:BCCT family transporter [Nocardiopsis gilva]ASU85770.1 BCCT family transporter [Nocardiopsis gilva YIM 90087]